MLYRSCELQLGRRTDKTVTAVLSSEFGVQRATGTEILSHSPGAVDLSRGARGYPLLFSHDQDLVVGRVEDVHLDGLKLRGELRPARNAKAQEVWDDIDGGILKDISISYLVDESSITREAGSDVYRVGHWSLLEVSVVSVPADPSVGIGRSNQNQKLKGAKDMERCAKCHAELTADGRCVECDKHILENERARVADITMLARHENLEQSLVDEYITQGKSFRDFSAMVIQRHRDRFNKSEIRVGNPAPGDVSLKPSPPFIGKRYAEIFGHSGSLGEWKSPDEFFQTIFQRIGDARLSKRALSEGVGSAGGFLLPSLVGQQFWDNSLEESIVLGKAALYPMVSESLRVPGMRISDLSSGLYGGVSATWTSEGLQPATDANPMLREILFAAHKLFLRLTSSNELLSDTPISTVINTVLRNAASHFLDEVFIFGSGVATPLGVLSPGNGALLTQARATAGQVRYADLTGMISKLNPNSFRRAVWLVHPSCLDYLNRLIVYDGVTGISHYALTGEGGALSLLSRPVSVTEKCGTLGSAYDVALIDFSQYAVALREDLGIQSSTDELFSRDMTAFKLIVRIDGSPLWDHPLVLRDGAYQVSPYVALV